VGHSSVGRKKGPSLHPFGGRKRRETRRENWKIDLLHKSSTFKKERQKSSRFINRRVISQEKDEQKETTEIKDWHNE